MYFLIQMKFKTDGTVEKGSSGYETMKDASVQFHIAMASAMVKDDVQKFTCVILNENGLTQKVEVYENPIVPSVVEEQEPEVTEEVIDEAQEEM